MIAGARAEDNPNRRQRLKQPRTLEVRTAATCRAPSAQLLDGLSSGPGPRVPQGDSAPAPCSVSDVESCYTGDLRIKLEYTQSRSAVACDLIRPTDVLCLAGAGSAVEPADTPDLPDEYSESVASEGCSLQYSIA